MKTNLPFFLSFALILFTFASCGEGSKKTDIVESGTYQGTIQEADAAETEIYVKTEKGKTLELYFTDETTLTKAGEPVEFSMLKKGQKVKVTVEKVGKRLDPISVTVME